MEGTPHLLTDVKFSERRRGYAPEEVDNFLERVSAAVAQLQDKLRDATARAEEADARINEAKRAQTVAEAQVDQLKAELQKVSDGGEPTLLTPATPATDPADDAEAASTLLLMAKKTADATIDDARNAAEKALADARARATTLLSDAEAESIRVRTEAKQSAEDLVREQRDAARSEVVALEEMKGTIQADVEALQRHVDREREDLRAAVARLSEVIENPAALRVGNAPVEATPGVEALLAPAAGVEAVDEVDDAAPSADPGLSVDEEGDVDLDAELDGATVASSAPHEPTDVSDAPAAGVENIDEVDDEVPGVIDVTDATEDEVVSSEKLFADEPEAEAELDLDADPPTQAFQPFADDDDEISGFDAAPRNEDEDKAMRAFFETDFESMEDDKRSRWRR